MYSIDAHNNVDLFTFFTSALNDFDLSQCTAVLVKSCFWPTSNFFLAKTHFLALNLGEGGE